MYIGGNKLIDVPDSVGKLNQLQALNLSDNMLERLPAAIANLKNLKSLLIHKNRLRTLPTEIIALKCLTEVCIVSALAGMICFLAYLNWKQFTACAIYLWTKQNGKLCALIPQHVFLGTLPQLS